MYQAKSLELLQNQPVSNDFNQLVNQAISFNNLSVVELRSQNYHAALDAAKEAFTFIQESLLQQMNDVPAPQLKTNVQFLENLQVLLVSYFNYGMCQLKIIESENEHCSIQE